MAKKTTITLGEALDIAHASKLKERLAGCLAKNLPVSVSAEKVEKADTAGLQIMCCFIKEVEQMGNSVTWQKPNDSIYTIAQLLGLTSALRLE